MHNNFLDLNPKYSFEQSKKNEKTSLMQFKKKLEEQKRRQFLKFINAGNKLSGSEISKLSEPMK